MKELLNRDSVCRMIQRWFPGRPDARTVRIHTDTTDFFRVDYDDVVVLGEKTYLIRHNAREGRFGLDDEEKFWVKRAFDLQDGSRKILKLVFHERFITRIGDIEFECFRSPKKEARILKLAHNHQNFMNGYGATDEKGNIVRVLDFIYGKPLSTMVEDIRLDHETYFNLQLPVIMENFIECIRAIRFIHEHEEKHGDIRRDHIIVDRESGHYRWIDYDFNYHQRENIYSYDLFGLGNILIFLVGKGDVLLPNLIQEKHPALYRIRTEDENIVFHNRVANLRKIYPYIPERLNRILLHFSKGANRFYETTNQLLEDLEEYRTVVGLN
ncbi:MAG: serine/threonine protein kinase [Desulfobacteraceae bacterium]|nr:serine/threonine protein kinase [Desulfobacteraceae bacterium]